MMLLGFGGQGSWDLEESGPLVPTVKAGVSAAAQEGFISLLMGDSNFHCELYLAWLLSPPTQHLKVRPPLPPAPNFFSSLMSVFDGGGASSVGEEDDKRVLTMILEVKYKKCVDNIKLILFTNDSGGDNTTY